MQPSDECQRLNERASRLYDNGDYPGARRLWEEVLRLSPEDPQALQGHRLASILADRWSPGPDETGGGDGTTDRAAGIESLLESGRVEEAMQAAQSLLGDRPDDPFAQQIHATALRSYEAEPFIREHITRARALADEGRAEEARGCCRKVLALDEMNREAQELLRFIEDPSGRAIPSLQGAPAQTPEAVVHAASSNASRGRAFTFAEEISKELNPDVGDALVRAAESVSGGLMDMPKTDPSAPPLKLGSLDFNTLDEEIERLHTTSGADEGASEQPPSMREAFPSWAAGSGNGEDTAASGADDDRPPWATGAGFDEPSAGSPDGSGDAEPEDGFHFPTRGRAGRPQGGGEASGAEAGGSDLGMMWDAEAAPAEPAGAAGGDGLAEARRHFQDGQFEQAIGAASRLLAVHPDHHDAADLIERARSGLERQARELEELMDEAHRHVENHRLEEAAQTLRRLLDLNSHHREAAELLDRVTREQRRSEETADIVVSPPVVTQAVLEQPEAVPLVRPDPPAGSDFDKPKRQEPGARPMVRPAAAGRSLPRLPSRSALAAVAAIVVLAGGWYGWGLMSGSGGSPTPATEAPAPRRAKKTDATAAASPAAPARARSQDPTGDPKDLLREGRQAWDAGRTEEAVKYLNAAVTANPEDASARSLLIEAKGRLEQEQKRDYDLAEARKAFAEQRYSDALRIWYRLPEKEQHGELLLAMRNAWFNMAVEDLQIGDCRDASQHFGEVLAINPSDRQATEGKKMAESYRDRQKDEAYIRFANSLDRRALDQN